MPRLSRLSIALLPLALCATSAAAQEAEPRPSSAAAGPRQPPAQREAPRQLQQRPMADAAARGGQRYAPPAQQAPAQQERSPISSAVRQVKRSTGGQILGAEQIPYEGRHITRVKYMDERGRVRYMDMDDPGAAERRAPRRTNNGQP